MNPFDYIDGIEPLSDEQQKSIAFLLEKSRQAIDSHEEQRKHKPRLDFIAAAIRSGFTETQAQFMWDNSIWMWNRPLSEWKA